MLEMLFVGAIVLVATLYSTWALTAGTGAAAPRAPPAAPGHGPLVPAMDRPPHPFCRVRPGHGRQSVRRLQFEPPPRRQRPADPGRNRSAHPGRDCGSPRTLLR